MNYPILHDKKVALALWEILFSGHRINNWDQAKLLFSAALGETVAFAEKLTPEKMDRLLIDNWMKPPFIEARKEAQKAHTRFGWDSAGY